MDPNTPPRSPLTLEQLDAWRASRRTPEHWLRRVARGARTVHSLHLRPGPPADLVSVAEGTFQACVRRAFDTGATLDEVAAAAGLVEVA